MCHFLSAALSLERYSRRTSDSQGADGVVRHYKENYELKSEDEEYFLFVTYTNIQSITSSEMCALHLTHPSAHTPGVVSSQCCSARRAVGGSVPCSRNEECLASSSQAPCSARSVLDVGPAPAGRQAVGSALVHPSSSTLALTPELLEPCWFIPLAPSWPNWSKQYTFTQLLSKVFLNK